MTVNSRKSLEVGFEVFHLLEVIEPVLPIGNLDDRVGLRITYCTFFFSGASSIAMWSCTTLDLSIFDDKYPEDRVNFVFPIVSMSTLLIINLYMIMAGRQLSMGARMYGSLAIYAFFMVLLPLVNMITLPHDVGYPLTLLALMGSTVSSSIMQSSMYGLGGVFGPIFIQAIESGKGCGAILLLIVRLFLKWFLEDNVGDKFYHFQLSKLTVGVIFGVALLIVIVTWVLFWTLLRTKFAQPLLTKYALVQHETPLTQALSPLTSPLSPVRRPHAFFRVDEGSPLLANDFHTCSDGTFIEFENDEEDEEDAGGMEGKSEEHVAAASIMNVIRTALKPFFSLFFSYFVCLSCFPGIISIIPSVTLNLGDWYPIVLVGCYNLGDLFGKILPVYVLYFDMPNIHLSWPFQLSFLPFFVAAHVHPFNDITIVLAVFLLGLITGYVATSSFILAPNMCSEYQREVAGMVAGLSSIIGLCAGSYNGLVLEAIVRIWTRNN
ncbi:equilibrative nucleoside transporter family [Plasmopara halstedii]|uniref:Equilibrative nucleoside transporter family n=1 Tax=Plasmopara halstedii TaxID=4781 RepID=A0A0P1AUB9_PLAHL|nr:equilibrative nucleoside transporter family [Plasmopara halstedii]CEG45954.1 equilibrative nucleoside transporter family [Plasmopara halstedii]|eukprot:XP_024582323.1 equilibrative nucleoside transporter family [Plasmopara halstedii]